jgi:hypothetical protein
MSALAKPECPIDRDREDRRLSARIYNFPHKVANLRAKIEAMRDEARELGFEQEAAQLAAMAVFADCWAGPPASSRDRGWSDEQTATLKRLWLEGLSASKIGKEVGKSRSAVLGASYRLNLPKRRLPR